MSVYNVIVDSKVIKFNGQAELSQTEVNELFGLMFKDSGVEVKDEDQEDIHYIQTKPEFLFDCCYEVETCVRYNNLVYLIEVTEL
jgi:hypothetical protein